MSSSAPLAEVNDLAIEFPVTRGSAAAMALRERARVRAVDGVSLRVDHGELVALVGESGSGKTTTARAVLRMIDVTSGSIRFDGEDITHVTGRRLRRLRRRMQMIYQDPYESLDPRFRVSDTLSEPIAIHKLGDTPSERKERMHEALTRAGLQPTELYLNRRPHELSGGQRQRVAIAASLIVQPDLLVADEPVSMLDVSLRAGILRVLDGLRTSGLGVLMITHDLATVTLIADRVAVMYLGRIVEEGPVRDVITRPQHPYTRALVSVAPRRPGRADAAPVILRGEIPDGLHIPVGCRFHPRCPLAQERCRATDPELRPAGADGQRAACIRLGEFSAGKAE